ncbi:NAD(P)/FAD-dependent oxidoreductase [Pelagibacterium sp.]|uniref:NAD(P)/FAD-dependent oxidoreductase n=1 Tax=Pelagibacterium sp. TaxID=1967288 RepID=UPI003A8D6CF3
MTDIIVLGAGMVGVSTALALLERGHDVTLVDRQQPGQETSYGNAGIIQAEAVEPYAFPLDPRALFAIATGRTNDVAYRVSDLRHWATPALRYAWHSRPTSYRAKVIPPWSEMIRSATRDHAALIAAAGADDLITRRGFRQGYRSARALEKAAKAADRLRARFGVGSALMDGNTLSQSEPGLRLAMAGAIHWTDAWTCSDPGELVQRYAELFRARGGRVAIGAADAIEKRGSAWSFQNQECKLYADQLVVCLGPWSPAFLRQFGHNFPMVLKRGYHQHFAVENGPRLPFMDVASGTVMSPMRQGLRVLTGAELAAPDAAPGNAQIGRSVAAASELFDVSEPFESKPWIGTRPCMPDMLPVIGRSDRDKKLWFNFGHGHQGFTLGPTTARIFADQFS